MINVPQREILILKNEAIQNKNCFPLSLSLSQSLSLYISLPFFLSLLPSLLLCVCVCVCVHARTFTHVNRGVNTSFNHAKQVPY